VLDIPFLYGLSFFSDDDAGIDSEGIEIISNSATTMELYMNMLKSAKKEILLIIPTTNSFIRQDKIGAIQLAKNALKERHVEVRILMPKV
jgi:phosphatidylserine/phosphatidylglycerophosphate/cardiolipin synthase-like enzyme